MANGMQELLFTLLDSPAAIAEQADLATAAALARQEIAFRQRAGAAAAQLRLARAEGADSDEIAKLQASLNSRILRLQAATTQARTADIRRPRPDAKIAQVFGRALGPVDHPPLTAAAVSGDGEIVGRAAVSADGIFHLTQQGNLTGVFVQLSDAQGRVVFRSVDPVTVAAGTVTYLDVTVQAPKPEPGPVPGHATMPELIGQSEAVAQVVLQQIGISNIRISDEIADGTPGIVIGQTPKAGTELTGRKAVALTVRRAKAGPGGQRFLPQFIGGTLLSAEPRLKELKLEAVITRVFDDSPAETVLAQEPGVGSPLAGLKTVALTVSQGRDQVTPATVTVPSLLGKSQELAVELAKATALKAEIIITADPLAAAGVIGQHPAAGTVVSRGATVRITINTPPETGPERIVLPDLIGRTVADAQKLLAELKLEAKVSTKSDSAPKGQVIAQEPGANTRLDSGTTIALIVSSGAEGRPRPDVQGTAAVVALGAEMARDPRAVAAGLHAAGIGKMLLAAGVTTRDGATVLAALAPEPLRAQLNLPTQKAAASLRAVLRKALKGMG